ncbi:hypothetical protein SAMN05444369_108101 [Capnocytophaga haemolytica]|uniref:RNA helicase n=1 Tax=Capnocytophaga haemolytica TaxID=45243 RepID=A0AAX2GZP0_9FLAO|nr:hypothetical protein [Capnocytophaga haemolytica]AMD84135.1 hypothetical protein AXF12_00415 [Capnocytophaga haemolytica]SFO07539.1 hypothetical protein SAMN05444369_108101 [Capnocytophaga haemolytica]SNV13195.1 Uncharacterised protein [Capnocytophaga haemolytica]
MPISPVDDYPDNHWKEVKTVLEEAIKKVGFEPNIVSDDSAIGLIHERIVNNIYNNEIVLCDVSNKNPNVMFELGMRLAFDKPIIIIKDEKTNYIFDTGVIEHLTYPSDLNYCKILEFKNLLGSKIIETYKKSKDKNYSPFLKTFGTSIIPKEIQKNEISSNEYIIQGINAILRKLILIENKDYMSYEDTKMALNDVMLERDGLVRLGERVITKEDYDELTNENRRKIRLVRKS